METATILPNSIQYESYQGQYWDTFQGSSDRRHQGKEYRLNTHTLYSDNSALFYFKAVRRLFIAVLNEFRALETIDFLFSIRGSSCQILDEKY